MCGSANAKPLIESEEINLNFDAEIVAGYFTSSETYGNPEDSPSWTEGYAKFGLSGDRALQAGTLFGSANVVYSATGGDGDAAGFTTGDESEFDIEDFFVGFRNDVFLIFGWTTECCLR